MQLPDQRAIHKVSPSEMIIFCIEEIFKIKPLKISVSKTLKNYYISLS